MKRDAVDALYFDLVGKLNKQLKDVEKRVEQQKIEEEQERLRKIQEQMELERKRREEEERKRKQEEEDRRMWVPINEWMNFNKQVSKLAAYPSNLIQGIKMLVKSNN